MKSLVRCMSAVNKGSFCFVVLAGNTSDESGKRKQQVNVNIILRCVLDYRTLKDVHEPRLQNGGGLEITRNDRLSLGTPILVDIETKYNRSDPIVRTDFIRNSVNCVSTQSGLGMRQ